MTYTVEADTLTQFGTNVLTALGVLPMTPTCCRTAWSRPSCGGIPPMGCSALVCGAAPQRRDGHRHPKWNCRGFRSCIVLEGHHGIGQVLTAAAVEVGVERSRIHGVSAVGVRNSNHFGTAAYFTRRSAEAGCGHSCPPTPAPQWPWGGRTKAVGTNPWSIAAPAGRYGVAVMDIANTAVARGKIYLAAERGEDVRRLGRR